MEIVKVKNFVNRGPEWKQKLAHFFYEHLEEFRDPLDQIIECLEHAQNNQGHIYCMEDQESSEIMASVVVLETNMKSFVPPYLLVYIAINKNFRGRGLGQKILSFVQNDLDAPIALHVEHENPARKLFEKMGFTSKYAEMRWRY